MKKRNKEAYLAFSEDYRKKIKAYFNSLKEDEQKSISQDEIEEPLITLEIAKKRKEVTKLIEEIDDDGSGEIEFGEFLDILKGKSNIYGKANKEKSNPNAAIMEFFKCTIIV